MQTNRAINVGPRERWASVIGGAALAAFGIWRRSWWGSALAFAGGVLVYRGATGHCDVKESLGGGGPVHIERTITLSKSPEEAYEMWRNLENLPRYISHLSSVKDTGNGRSHWTVKGPAGLDLAWDAEMTNDARGHAIEWRSVEGSTIRTRGAVRFARKQGNRGTKVHLSMWYELPGGAVGQALARWLAANPEQKIDEGLQQFKEALETA